MPSGRAGTVVRELAAGSRAWQRRHRSSARPTCHDARVQCSKASPIRTGAQVYHPATDTWTEAAAYPDFVGYAGCGAISGKIYCAGGYEDITATDTADAYVYDPAANSWSPITPYPIDN